MSRFLSARHNALAAYTPGEQPADMQYIKLNTNESPYPPSPAVLAALQNDELKRLNLYPNPDGTALLNKIAEAYKVRQENVIIGNGSDELLAFAFLAFFDGGVVFPDITYGFYPVYGNLYNLPFTEISVNDELAVNVSDYIGIGKNVVLANPNAPTGIALELCDIEAIAENNPNHIVLIDEAYVDFGADSVVELTKKYDNLLVLHTFSKSRSMAGARLAYAIASKPIIDDMQKMKYSFNPYNVNRLTQTLGLAALSDACYYEKKQREIAETRDYTAVRLSNLGFEMTNSKANFLFARSPRIGGEELYLKLKQKGILIRHFNKPRIADYVRITVGTKEQMESLITAVTEVLQKP